MPRSLFNRTLALLAGLLLPGAMLLAQPGIPLPAHSHNDYDQPRPLFDALQLRFASVEADIYLVDSELRVGHDQQDLLRGRTLGNLYLEPLRLLAMRGVGQIYPETTTPIVLLVDIKSEAEETFRQLERALGPYERFLTRFSPAGVEPGAVTVVVSGNRPVELISEQAERWVAVDGRLSDLTGGQLDASLMPVVSGDWREVFSWRGSDEMPAEERAQLDTLVQLARAQNAKLRFWNAPDIPPVWAVLYDAGVDLINTDRPTALREFLLGNP